MVRFGNRSHATMTIYAVGGYLQPATALRDPSAKGRFATRTDDDFERLWWKAAVTESRKNAFV